MTPWDPMTYTAADWQAIGTCVTAVVALVAALLAYRQVREARRLREEQSQPYVVASHASSLTSQVIEDVVIKNFGATAAFDVRVKFDPPLVRSSPEGGVERVELFQRLPTLVPGQEYRTFWDAGHVLLNNVQIPKNYSVSVNYKDSRGKDFGPYRYTLNLNEWSSRQFSEVFTIHHAAQALRSVSDQLKRLTESGHLRVIAEDGARRRRIDRWRRGRDPRYAGLKPTIEAQFEALREGPQKSYVRPSSIGRKPDGKTRTFLRRPYKDGEP